MISRKPLQIFLAVEKALFLRELNTRISVGKAGLFWTFFEPFMQVAMFMLIRVAMLGKSSSNYDIAVFMASGFIAFNMFRTVLSSSTGAFTANHALFNYKQVKPIDTIMGRMLVSIFITSIIVLMFLFLAFFFQYENFLPENFLLVFLGYFWLALFTFGVSLVVAIGNTFFVSIGKIVGILTFGLMIFSAVFFPVISVPPEYQEILLYNPLVHFMELIHGAYMYELDDRFVDYGYMALWTIVPLFMGTWLYSKLEKRIIAS